MPETTTPTSHELQDALLAALYDSDHAAEERAVAALRDLHGDDEAERHRRVLGSLADQAHAIDLGRRHLRDGIEAIAGGVREINVALRELHTAYDTDIVEGGPGALIPVALAQIEVALAAIRQLAPQASH